MKSLGVKFLLVAAILPSTSFALNPLLPEKIELCEGNAPCVEISELSKLKNIVLENTEKTRKATVTLQVAKAQLAESGWLYIGEVGDTTSVVLNKHLILDLRDRNRLSRYYRYLSIFIPIPPDILEEKNIFSFEIIDLNQTIFGIRGNLSTGTFSEVIIKAAADFLMRTGSSLLSAFTLLFLATFSTIALYFVRSRQLFFLSLYGAISILYLISFSEIPRSIFDPILFSGPIHFSLRLLQDLTLCILLLNVLRFSKRFKPSIYLNLLYGLAIFALWITYNYNKNFPSVQKVMFFCAPLVAFPTLFGLLLSRNLPDIVERSWNTRFFVALVILQINDLLVFWQIFEGYFFVKWYIPLLFTFIFFIVMRRASISVKDQAVKVRLGEELKRFAHDIRSPLSALKIGVAEISKNTLESEGLELIRLSLERITDVAASVLGNPPQNNRSPTVFSVIEKTRSVCSTISKSRDILISFTPDEKSKDGSLLINESELIRILENLIQNSCNACSKIRGKIQVTCIANKKVFSISIQDNGPGFDSLVRAGVGAFGVTGNKGTGFGLGLAFAVQIIEASGGKIVLSNIKPNGASVKITLPIKI